VVTENGRVKQAVALLTRGDLAGVGPLLYASHASLRDDFEVSWPEADVAVYAAMAAGALGARMMGGGFGDPAREDRPPVPRVPRDVIPEFVHPASGHLHLPGHAGDYTHDLCQTTRFPCRLKTASHQEVPDGCT
jgi:hypothetical protein